jgi:hypothetical protein
MKIHIVTLDVQEIDVDSAFFEGLDDTSLSIVVEAMAKGDPALWAAYRNWMATRPPLKTGLN